MRSPPHQKLSKCDRQVGPACKTLSTSEGVELIRNRSLLATSRLIFSRSCRLRPSTQIVWHLKLTRHNCSFASYRYKECKRVGDPSCNSIQTANFPQPDSFVTTVAGLARSLPTRGASKTSSADPTELRNRGKGVMRSDIPQEQMAEQIVSAVLCSAR